MTNDEKYTKVAQALQTLRNDCTGTMAHDATHRVDIIASVRTVDACNAMLKNVAVDDMVKLFDLIAGDKP